MTNDFKNSSNTQLNSEKSKVQPNADRSSEEVKLQPNLDAGKRRLADNDEKKSVRQFFKKFKKSSEQDEQVQKSPNNRVRVRLIPIWLRIIIVLVLLLLAVVFGAMFGYAILGDGDVSDTFKPDTWKHIFDIMNGVE